MRVRRQWVSGICAGAIVLAMAPVKRARALPVDPECTTRIATADRSSLWAAPLDRIVSVRLPDATLREALDHIAAVSKVELSYSNELLPTRRVCVALNRVPVGAVLETLLAETSLRAIVVGSVQVVLAPSRPIAATMPVAALSTTALGVGTVPVARRTSMLDRVVVTGTPDGVAQRGSPFALEVIEGATLARQRASSLGEALDLAVPGVWTWSATAGTLAARYGSIRGASSFGVSAPKVYLDGIEVANPLLVTQIDPARIERVEVIRGPQGAALYGADAISGVVNILTRHDGSASGAPTLQVSTLAGVAATAYAPRSAFVQEHTVALRGGSGKRTYGMGLHVGTVGEYVPGASERRVLADADLRLVLANAVITGTGRLSHQKANASTSLMFGDVASSFSQSARQNRTGAPIGAFTSPQSPPSDSTPFRRPPPDSIGVFGDSATGQDMTQYTLGGTITAMPSLQWTHTLIAGVDGYRLQGLSTGGLPMPAAYGSALLDGAGGADRGTLRVRAVGRFDLSDRSLLALTFAGEQAFTRELVDVAGASASQGVTIGLGPNVQAVTAQSATGLLIPRWGSSAGVTAQANLSLNETWYFVAGGRAERSVGFTDTPQRALLPMLGAAYVRDVEGMVVKLRTAYGTGIRPASTLTRGTTWMGRAVNGSARALQPESQTGIEAGVDVLMGSRLSVHVTRFDQRASGLIQPVAGTSTYALASGTLARRMSYRLENVGAITNRGWEMQARSSIDRFSLTGTLSLVDSRVDQLAYGYGGELRVGDRMLDVPARTYSLSAGWNASRFSLTTMLTRAEDWMGYDRVAIGDALTDLSRPEALSGRQLRRFWLNYDGITRLRATASYRVAQQWSLMFGGENLLNVQRGAPDNATVTAGRTLTFGLRSGW